MNMDQIRDSIVVKWSERDGHRVATARLSVSREIHIHKQSGFEPASSDSCIEEKLKLHLMNELYEDRRNEVWKAVEAVNMANPYTSDLPDKLNHLFGLIKAMQPK
jgi:hypothetical protein